MGMAIVQQKITKMANKMAATCQFALVDTFFKIIFLKNIFQDHY